jgi:hypothetical protein
MGRNKRQKFILQKIDIIYTGQKGKKERKKQRRTERKYKLDKME